MILRVNRTTADVIESPDESQKIGKNESQLLYGESFQVEEEKGEYYYGSCTHDGYKGHVLKSQLSETSEPTHLIHVPSTHIYPEATFKSRPIMSLSFLSRVSLTDTIQNGFAQTADGNWLFTSHCVPIPDFKPNTDLSETAIPFLGTPYLYAGRSIYGIDCSGLIQILMMAHDYKCPARDCGDQQIDLGTAHDFGDVMDPQGLQHNDIVYFKGHVGIMIEETHILSATCRHMRIIIEKLSDIIPIYEGVTDVRRL